MAIQNGTDGADVLTGGPDGDILVGNGGSDTLVASGTGFTFAAYWSSPGPVRVELFREAVFDGFGDPGSEDALRGIHGVFGSAFGDGMLGSDLTNVLVGLDGDDTVLGLGGDDVLNGGGGHDSIDGGAGDDTAVYNGQRSDYTISASDTGFTIADNRGGGDDTDTVAGVEVFEFDDGILTAANLLTGTPTRPTPPSDTSTAGDDSITGTAGGDRIDALAGNDTVKGLDGDDTLIGGAGDDLLDGGAGHDVAEMDGIGFRNAGPRATGDGGVVITTSLGADTLANVEVVTFADGRLVMDADDPAARVARLYEAALDRLPDQGGLNFWIDAVQDGRALAELARGFLDSAEFQSRFGDVSSNGAFVDQLYLNVLGRAGEAGGRQFWVDSLNSGASRSDVLVAFSESAENKAGTAALVQAGIWDRSEAATEVARLYDTVFGRLPDAQGLTFWKNGLEGGTATPGQMADAFTGSAEFSAKYGTLGNREFADALYVNTLDRAADQAGLDYWTGQLDAGAARSAVVLAFSESREHVALTAGGVQSENPGEFGILFA